MRAVLCSRVARRVAEDNLGSHRDECGSPGGFATQRVSALVAAPGYASGDLRKSQQLAHAEAAKTGIDERAFLEAGYDFCHEVLTARWPQVQALAGALLARGTLDGPQLEALVSRQRQAQDDDDWMHAIARFPLIFGGVWALLECPTVGAREAGATDDTGSRYSL